MRLKKVSGFLDFEEFEVRVNVRKLQCGQTGVDVVSQGKGMGEVPRWHRLFHPPHPSGSRTPFPRVRACGHQVQPAFHCQAPPAPQRNLLISELATRVHTLCQIHTRGLSFRPFLDSYFLACTCCHVAVYSSHCYRCNSKRFHCYC